MSIHLYHKQDKFLWISSRTKPFVIYLQFSFVYFHERQHFGKMGADAGEYGYGLGLRDAEQDILMLF